MEHVARNDDTRQRSRSRTGTRSTPGPGSPPCADSTPGLAVFLLVSPPYTSASTRDACPFNELLARPDSPSRCPGQSAQDKRHHHDRYRREHWWMRDQNPTDPRHQCDHRPESQPPLPHVALPPFPSSLPMESQTMPIALLSTTLGEAFSPLRAWWDENADPAQWAAPEDPEQPQAEPSEK
jgi:hypothetical protein